MRRDILKLGLDPVIHFEAIGRLKSLKLAAHELGLSQPAVTQSLKKLEMSLGVSLCVRNRSLFVLTEPGKRLYEISQAVKLRLKNFENYLENTESFDGVFSVGILDNIQNKKLEMALEKLVQHFPKVKLSIQSYTADEIQDLVCTGELDVGVGVFNQKNQYLTYVQIGSEKICHYISDRHTLWRKKSISEEDVSGAHVTWSDMVSRDRTALEVEIFSRNHSEKNIHIGSYANNLNAAVFILRTGVGIVSLPEGHLESRKLDFEYKQLNDAFKPFFLKQEVVMRKEFAENSQITQAFFRLMRN